MIPYECDEKNDTSDEGIEMCNKIPTGYVIVPTTKSRSHFQAVGLEKKYTTNLSIKSI